MYITKLCGVAAAAAAQNQSRRAGSVQRMQGMWNRAKENIKAHETDTNKKRKAGETDELRKFRQKCNKI